MRAVIKNWVYKKEWLAAAGNQSTMTASEYYMSAKNPGKLNKDGFREYLKSICLAWKNSYRGEVFRNFIKSKLVQSCGNVTDRQLQQYTQMEWDRIPSTAFEQILQFDVIHDITKTRSFPYIWTFRGTRKIWNEKYHVYDVDEYKITFTGPPFEITDGLSTYNHCYVVCQRKMLTRDHPVTYYPQHDV